MSGSPRSRVRSYRDALGRAGHGIATHDVMMCLHTFIGESPSHARDYPRPYLTNYFELAAAANRVDAANRRRRPLSASRQRTA